MKYITAAAVLLIIFAYSSFAQLMHPYNLDFEDGVPGHMPFGWDMPSSAIKNGYSAELTNQKPYEGKQCLMLKNTGESAPEIFGSVLQIIDAAPYRGKRIRFRAAVRAEIHSNPGSAHLWVKENLPQGAIGFIDLMDDEPIIFGDWKMYEITGDISEFAQNIDFGLLLKGTGYAWIDNASFEIINDKPITAEKASPLSGQALDNIMTFTKLAGYIRYFCPSIESQSLNWDRFIRYGIKTIEPVKDKNTLLDNLNQLFKPVAPALSLFTSLSKSKTKVPSAPPDNALPMIALGWKHIGPKTDNTSVVLKSEVVNIYKSPRDREGSVSQIIDATPFRGKHIIFSSYVKTEAVPPSGNAQLWLRIDGPGDKVYYTGTMYDKPIISSKWKNFSIEHDVPEDATFIRLGLVLVGDGDVWFDNTSLTAVSKSGKENIEPKNSGFEEGSTGKVTFGWRFTSSNENTGYSAAIVNTSPYAGKQCLNISSEKKSRLYFPLPGELLSENLGNGISFTMPLNLYVDSTHTLPYPPESMKIVNYEADSTEFYGKDRTSRLTIVSIFWNILKHFNNSGTEPEKWDELLKEALQKAAVDNDEISFSQTLQMLLPGLNDAQARIWHESELYKYGLPFLMKWYNNELVITAADSSAKVLPGDKITEINHIPVSNYFSTTGKFISGLSNELKIRKAIVYLRAGDKGTRVHLKIKPANGPEFEKDFERNILLSDLYELRPPSISRMENGIYYLDLTRIYDKDIKGTLDSLRNAKGIIFDLRGSTEASEHVLGLFSRESMQSIDWRIPIYTKPDGNTSSFKIIETEVKSRPSLAGKKCVFLTDERTVGYAEGLLAIVKKYNIGKIVGTATAGAAGEVFGFRLPAGYNASVTCVYGFDYNGNMLFGKALEPDIKVVPTLQGILDGHDEILEKAFGMLVNESQN